MFESLRNWYRGTRKKVAYFMLALVASYIFIVFSLVKSLPLPFLYISLCLTLIIPFSLFLMLATDNPIFENLQSKKWMVVTIGLIVTLYTSLSYIWSSNEVNAIFRISSDHLPWSTLILTVVYFFKNIILFCSLLAFIFVFFYSNIWVVRVFVTNYRGMKGLTVDIFSGIIFVVGLGLLIGTSGVLTAKQEEFAKLVAVNADFNTHHRCTGDAFKNSQGVLFLPTGNVLVAYLTRSKELGLTYVFDEIPCKE